jgi:allantoicase
VPDPRRLDGLPLDLVALENGGTVVAASDRFYSPPENMIGPGRPAVMGDGWETKRRRGPGHDWVLFRLAGAGHISQAVVDTSCFLGNAPATATVRACDASQAGMDGPDGLDQAEWFELLPPARLQPDTRHQFRIGPALSRGAGPDPAAPRSVSPDPAAPRSVSPDPAAPPKATHVRLEIHPDGGLARLRLFGELTGGGRARLGLAWFDRLPEDHALAVLAAECGLTGPPAAQLAARRPYQQPDRLDALLSGGKIPGLDPATARRARALVLG